MMEILRQITLSEVMLLFNLIFIVPMLVLLVVRLRRYEALYGELPKKGRRRKAAPAPPPEPEAGAPAAAPAAANAVPDDVFPYDAGTFLTAAEKACLAALRGALGPEVDVFPKVAIWEYVKSTDDNPGYAARLHGKDFDYLVCDVKLGQPLTAVMFEPGKGRPAGPTDELKKICSAAGANLVFIERRDDYDAAYLKKALGIPDLDI